MTLQSQCLGHAKTIVFRANKDAPKSPLKNCDHKSKKAGRIISQRTGVSIPQNTILYTPSRDCWDQTNSPFLLQWEMPSRFKLRKVFRRLDLCCFLFSQIAHMNMNTILKAQHQIVTHNLESSLCQKYSKKLMLAIQTKTARFDKTAECSTVVQQNQNRNDNQNIMSVSKK